MAKTAPQLEKDIRTALLKCRLTARGMWYEMRRLIETDSDRPGALHRKGGPISAEQLAQEAGCSAKKVPLLVEQLKLAGLIAISRRGVLYSPLLARVVHKRGKGRERTRRFRLKTRGGALRNAGCNAVSALQGELHPPPALSLSPTPPISIPPIPQEFSGCAGPPQISGTKTAKTRKKPTGPFAELNAYFAEKWQQKYKKPFPFRAVDGVKLAELLKACGGCLEDAKGVIDRYLADDDLFIHGHAPQMLMSGSMFPRYFTDKGSPNGHRKSAVDRGEYASDLPVVVRRVGSS